MDLRLRAAVEASPAGVILIDASGRIVLVNREVERMFGYTREELLGQDVEILVPERFRASHPAQRRGFLADPRVRAMGAGRDLFGVRKDRSEVPVEIGLTPVVTDEGMFVLGSIVDITARKAAEAERRALEEELRQSQKMEAIGTLAGGIAHDFNNLLAAIVGYAELARDALPPDARARSELAEVLKSAERGRQLVQRILAFSRRQEPNRRPLDLAASIDDTAKLLRAMLPASIEIRASVDPATPRVLADATSLQQVLLNLSTNAAHAMPSGGTLEIRADPWYARDSHVRANPELHEGPYVRVRVRDDGCGMEPRVLERAREPFFTTKPPGQGTGLGLSIVHAIIREHEGLLEIESEPGHGTEVRCHFPALESAEIEAPASREDVPHGAGERVLYVDDEPALLQLGGRRLESLGYRVTTVSDGARALEIFRAGPHDFDLVVTDYWMPRLTGLELARGVSAARPGTPIVMLTGFIGDLPADALSSAGVTRLVGKPFNTQQLARVVRDVLDLSKPA